ncbi:hypothetical protein FF1_031488 [Malus domestica]
MKIRPRFKDEDNALILLNSLPDSYEHFVTTIMHGKETVKFEDVSNAWMNYEMRHRDKNHDSTFEALFVKGRSSEMRSSSSMKKITLST